MFGKIKSNVQNTILMALIKQKCALFFILIKENNILVLHIIYQFDGYCIRFSKNYLKITAVEIITSTFKHILCDINL